MAGFTMNLNDEKLLNICVDQIRDGDISGEIYHHYSARPDSFIGVGNLIRKMEQILDGHGFPMATVQARKFEIKRTKQRKRENRMEADYMSAEQVTAQKGAKGTFLVKIQCRQNATWQGNVMWGEKNCTQQFRSALELLKLIDSALEESETTSTEKTDD